MLVFDGAKKVKFSSLEIGLTVARPENNML